MCVKEFLGYNCGHCSVPYLRQCPLTESNPIYPPCKIPAERPIFTNENCHACARVLWNQRVLAEEEKHRNMHATGQCECEVIFDAEERERRLRPRSRGKGKGRDFGGRNHHHGRDTTSYNEASGSGYQGHLVPGQYRYNQRDDAYGGEYSQHQQQQQRQAWGNDAKTAAYQYVGYYTGGDAHAGNALAHVAQGFGFPEGGYVPQSQLWEGQTMMDQNGAGMKFYPDSDSVQVLPALPPIPPASTVPINTISTMTTTAPTSNVAVSIESAEPASVLPASTLPIRASLAALVWQRAASEPIEPTPFPESPVEVKADVNNTGKSEVKMRVSSSPAVVCSDTANTMSD